MPSIFASDNDPTFCDTRIYIIFIRGGCLGALGQGHHGLKQRGTRLGCNKNQQRPSKDPETLFVCLGLCLKIDECRKLFFYWRGRKVYCMYCIYIYIYVFFNISLHYKGGHSAFISKTLQMVSICPSSAVRPPRYLRCQWLLLVLQELDGNWQLH